MMHCFTLSSIERAAKDKPAGYVADLISHGNVIGETVTLTDEAYTILTKKYGDRESKPRPADKQKSTQLGFGPGTELKALLKKIGIEASPSCSCAARAQKMDDNEAAEPGWCEANIDTVVGWLREEAKKRKLPFLDAAARLLVRRAIANARRKAAANAQRPPHHDRRETVAPPVHETEG